MMDTHGMVGQCMDAMGSMMGSTMFVALLLVLLVWVIGLAAVGALGYWAFRKLSGTQHRNG